MLCFKYQGDSLTYTIPLDFTIADKDIIVECEFYPTNYWNWLYMILVDTSEVSKRIGVVSSSYDVHSEGLEIANAGYNKWIPLRIEYINGTATVYVNGSIKEDVTFTDVNAVLLRLSSSYTTKIRNIKFLIFFDISIIVLNLIFVIKIFVLSLLF